MSESILEMKDIEKEYFGNKVLKGININVKPGEIHAIVGENGAGKSTLMNILFGMPVIHSTGGFKGEIYFNGKKTEIKCPKDAMNLGIGMVHQEFMLLPSFTITENIKLNREKTKNNFLSKIMGEKVKTLDMKAMGADSRKSLDKVGMTIDEWAMVEGLPVGYMQFIEIAREIDKSNIKLLVFDEPTAVLTESEAEHLIDCMKKLAEEGIGIIFITHRLDEVMMAADSITVLRDGEMVANKKRGETNVVELAELMVGRKIERLVNKNESAENEEQKETIMEIKNLKVLMPGEEVKDVSLNIKRGEILGIGGLAGQGKIGIANGIMGLYESKGEVLFKGKAFKLNNTSEALKSGLAFVSEDRRGVGLLLDKSMELNIVISSMQIKNEYLKKIGFFTQMDSKNIRKHALKMINELDIRCRGPQQKVRQLSGGNQQKICIARALTLKPEILFVSEPTRGIDIGAKKLILDLLVKLNKEQGMTIVMTSSELSELRAISDRIVIISKGKIEGILKPDDSDADFGLMMAGHYHKIQKEEL
ncbi:MAG TPA: sugar ABC transporter ATP-binding protein [Clostridiaceae bacterium]|jgi:simple sugar transport system ATP-binding protein|nr:sugar ABC transporter ATP-binding protein [Clostridiaceae bacterium]HBF76430.1 sugar ABC transporter ATP-binding protein [Clostridiaceae bacterium]HBG39482.1 sugar ABC transporter ATP-binding protein [Clostridiaceae bacterium]HBN28177.1 sugar ABC transporter ATP-binding protein [Clostridiaceae bacterium]HBX47893.1 sugar ABC transporter ATP-binding protein [Clostridiaceae bacterium]